MIRPESTAIVTGPKRLGAVARVRLELQARLAKLPNRRLALLAAEPRDKDSQRELFRDACILNDAGFDGEEQFEIISARFENYYREILEREIRRAIAAAAGERRPGTKWPESNSSLITSLTKSSFGAASALRASSPIEDPGALLIDKVLDLLFAPTDLICLGYRAKSAGGVVLRSQTDLRESFRGRERCFELIVPNAMSAPRGLSQDGRVSERCLANSAMAWTHQVIEFDTGTEDEQAALISHLGSIARDARLRMVVHSGGKSLHAWFDVSALPVTEQLKFRRYAAALGADRAMFSLCQFARLPNAIRRDRNVQQAVRFLAHPTP